MSKFFDIASAFEERAFVTWRRLIAAPRGLHPGEDGVTEEHLHQLLLDLGSDCLVVDRYSGTGEGGDDKPNADIELWVTDETEVLGLRIQAKIIDPTLTSFAELSKTQTAVQQAKRLIENRQRSAPKYADDSAVFRYPVYCLYLATDDDAVSFAAPHWRRSYGCSLVGAPTLLAHVVNRRVSLADLAQHLVPWAWPFTGPLSLIESNLVEDCFGGGRDTLTHGAAGEDPLAGFSNAAIMPRDGSARVAIGDAPSYVRKLARKFELNLGSDDRFREPEGVSHVALLRVSRAHGRRD